MADIIDIRTRLDAKAAARGDTQPLLRIRLCGPDGRWLGLVGGILAGALLATELSACAVDAEGSTPSAPFIDLLAGARGPAAPALLVAAGALPAAALHGCTRQSLLLAGGAPATTRRSRPHFPGRTLALPLSDPAPTPLLLAAACAAGGARLLGIGWNPVEAGLRQELTLAEPFETYLIAAFETYHRLAPWAGAVSVRS